MAHLYLGRWEWVSGEDPHWRAPGGNNVGIIDLRSIPQMSLAGGAPQGYGLFSYETTQVHALLLVYLGDDPSARLTNPIKTSLEAHLGPLTGNNFRAIIKELLLNGDPTGLTKCKPIRGSLRRGMQIDLGGFGKLVEEPLTPTHPCFSTTVEVFRADYRRNKTLVAAETLRRFTGAECRKLFGTIDDTKARAILPTEFNNDGWEQPRTSIGDTFDRGDSGDLNQSNSGKTLDGSAGTWSWTEVLGETQAIITNRWVPGETCYARAEQDLSSDDHTCYIHVDRIADAPFNQIGSCARFAAAANTSYMAMFNWTSGEGVILRKTVAGTRSDVGSNVTLTVADNDKLETEINDSTLRSLVNDVQKDSLTDTSITGNLRCGIYGNSNGVGAIDFWAQDLSGETPLTITIAESLSNWLDGTANTVVGSLIVSITGDLNSWGDAQGFQYEYRIPITDQLVLSDDLVLRKAYLIHLVDDLANYLDSVSRSLSGSSEQYKDFSLKISIDIGI